MPKGKHLPYATPKENRMYEHIRDSGESKAIAAATVNKLRAKRGETKTAKGRKRG